MSLYMCVFDDEEEELEGIDVGSYDDFGAFRDAVASKVEGGEIGSVCPTLMNCSDCDTTWTPEQCEALLLELSRIREVFQSAPGVEFNSRWKSDVAKENGISWETAYGCFFDVDGENLIERIEGLARLAVKSQHPILFQ